MPCRNAKQYQFDDGALRGSCLYTKMETNNNRTADVTGFDALYDSMWKCSRGVRWKESTLYFNLHAVEKTMRLEEQLKDGTYKQRKPQKFIVTSPKRREIVSIGFRDRVYQRSLNDNAIYPAMTKSLIQDNAACQTGKGTDYARDRLKEMMRRHYRKHGTEGYVLQCDIKGYYPSMSHDVVKEKFRKHLDPEIYRMAEAILDGQYEGDIGYNPGSQMIQIAGIALLDEVDHFIKERLRVKNYIRYMDDFILIHEDKEFLKKCQEEIEKELAKLGFRLHPKKTRVYKISQGIPFLGFTFRLTKTGKVVMTIKSENVKKERKKLVRLVHKAKRGELTKRQVDECFGAWKAHASHGNSYKLIQRMEKFYKELWRENYDYHQTGKVCSGNEGGGDQGGGD